MVMDPSLKYEWFEQKWDEPPKCNWIPKVKSMVSNYWKRWQKTLEKLPIPQQVPPRRQHNDTLDEDGHKRISYASVKPHSQANAFTQYCAEDAIEDFKLSDWKAMERKQPYLVVQFAVDHTPNFDI